MGNRFLDDFLDLATLDSHNYYMDESVVAALCTLEEDKGKKQD